MASMPHAFVTADQTGSFTACDGLALQHFADGVFQHVRTLEQSCLLF